MNIQIRGSGTAIEFRRLTEEQYRYWSNEGEAALKRHLDGDDCVCPDSLAVTSTAEADHASLVGPCPYSAMMYITGDAGGDIEIDLGDIVDAGSWFSKMTGKPSAVERTAYSLGLFQKIAST